jgi:D-glycero-D-manno-heptose 1,7-bisphosphate phosphatase
VGIRFGEALIWRMVLRPAVFLDRDGTLNVQIVREGKPYAPERPEEFRLYDGAPEGCRALKAAGFVLVVATNQPDVGRGKVPQAAIEAMHVSLLELIPEIDRIEVCYDPGRGEPSRRRKPEPGMLLDAAAALGIDLQRSWMIGDRWRDVDCGKRAGVKTVFIDFGYSEKLSATPDFSVRTFPEAVAAILGVRKSPGAHA